MAISPAKENFDKFPDALLCELSEFLNDKNRFQQLEKMLHSATLILEKDDFQIPIHSVKDLHALRQYLLEDRNVLPV